MTTCQVLTFVAIAVLGLAHGFTTKAPSTYLTHINDTAMAISWNHLVPTPHFNPSLQARVQWGTSPTTMTHTVTAPPTMMSSLTENMSTYDYCGTVYVHHLLHSVVLTSLPVPQTIYYCADSFNASTNISTNASPPSCSPDNIHSFTTSTPSSSSELRFYATADMGDPVTKSFTAIPMMSQQCQVNGSTHRIPVTLGVHVGDIAYNLDIAPIGDNYLQGISQHMASHFPWMMTPGNHEADCNYTYQNYKGRFAAQNYTGTNNTNSRSSRWYSYDKGAVHFISMDTDAWGFDEVAYILPEQYAFIEQDLKLVDRTVTPWIVLMGHRPMYCSSALAYTTNSHLGWPKQTENMESGTPPPPRYGHGFQALGVDPPVWEGQKRGENSVQEVPSCGIDDLIRNGMWKSDGSGDRLYAMEPLMSKYHVNVYLTGHEHNYERTYPLMNGSYVKSYLKPQGKTVHVLTGAGGAYGKDPFGPAAYFDAFRSSEWSYSDIFVNQTHFILHQKLATNGSVIDEMVLTQ